MKKYKLFCQKNLIYEKEENRIEVVINIFEKNKINFDELLILSIKDLDMLQIIKKDRIKIKKYHLDYIKNTSNYSI